MKKTLLFLLMCIGFLIPAFTASAAETSYTITFASGRTSDNGTKTNAANLKSIITEGKDMVANVAIEGSGTFFAEDSKGVKLSSNNYAGDFTLDLSSDAKKVVSKISIYAASNGTASRTITLKVNGEKTFTTDVKGAELQDYDFKIDPNELISSLSFSVPKASQCYIKSITVYYDDGVVATPVPPVFDPGSCTFTGSGEVTLDYAAANKNFADDETYGIMYSINDGAETQYSESIKLNEEGTYTIKAWLYNPQNKSAYTGTEATATYVVEPIVPLPPVFTPLGGSYANSVDVTLAFAEENADFDTANYGIKYTIDNGAENIYSAPFTLTDEGTHVVTAWLYNPNDGTSYSDTELSQTYTITNAIIEILTPKTGFNVDPNQTASYKNYSYDSATGMSFKINMIKNSGNLQLNNNKTSGIVVTANKNGYKLHSIEVEWASTTTSGRELLLYGSSTAYSSPADLYGDEKGTELRANLVYNTNSSFILSNAVEYKYFGLLSNSGAQYITSIKLTYLPGTPDPTKLEAPVINVNTAESNFTITNPNDSGVIKYAVTNSHDVLPTSYLSYTEAVPFETAKGEYYIHAYVEAEPNTNHLDSEQAEVAHYTVTPPHPTGLYAPVFSEKSGTYTAREKVITISLNSLNADLEEGAYEIKYTLDGTDPTAESDTYTEPLKLVSGPNKNDPSRKYVLNAAVYRLADGQIGDDAEATYVIVKPAPVALSAPIFKSASGIYNETEVEITFADNNSGLDAENFKIQYKLDADADWTDYSGTIALNEEGTHTLTARVNDLDEDGLNLSPEVTATYYIYPASKYFIDKLTIAEFNASGSSYKDYDFESTLTGIKYSAYIAAGNNALQFNDSRNAAILTTGNSENMVLKAVQVKWNSNTANGRSLDMYSKGKVYSATGDLYDSSKSGSRMEGKSVSYNSTAKEDPVLTFDEVVKYYGIRPSSGALYVDCLTLVWAQGEPEDLAAPTITVDEKKEIYSISADTQNGTLMYALMTGDDEPTEADYAEYTATENFPDPTDVSVTYTVYAYVKANNAKWYNDSEVVKVSFTVDPLPDNGLWEPVITTHAGTELHEHDFGVKVTIDFDPENDEDPNFDRKNCMIYYHIDTEEDSETVRQDLAAIEEDKESFLKNNDWKFFVPGKFMKMRIGDSDDEDMEADETIYQIKACEANTKYYVHACVVYIGEPKYSSPVGELATEYFILREPEILAPTITPAPEAGSDEVIMYNNGVITLDFAPENKKDGAQELEDEEGVYSIYYAILSDDDTDDFEGKSTKYDGPITLDTTGEYFIGAYVKNNYWNKKSENSYVYYKIVPAILHKDAVTFDFTDTDLCTNVYGFGATAPAAGNAIELSGKTYQNGSLKMAVSTKSGSSGTRWFNSGGNYSLRIYSNNSVTFTAPEGKKILNVEVIFSSNNGGNVKINSTELSAPQGSKTVAVDGESVTVAAMSNTFIDKIVFNCEQTFTEFPADDLNVAADFFDIADNAGLVKDGVTTVPVVLTGKLHTIYVDGNQAHIQDEAQNCIRLENVSEINERTAFKELKAYVTYNEQTGMHHLIYVGHEEHGEESNPKPMVVPKDQPEHNLNLHHILSADNKLDEYYLHKFVKLHYVYYDAADGTISYTFDGPDQIRGKRRAHVNAVATMSLANTNGLNNADKSSFMSLTGVVDKDASGTPVFVPVREGDIVTGLQSVYGEDIIVLGNRIIAPEGTRVFNVSGIETGTEDLVPGIYLIVTPAGATTKCMVK